MKKITNISNKDLKRRIITISYEKGLSHLGSCLTAVDIIDEIFRIKKPDEKFVLSAGHAGLALYCVLEKYSHPEYGKSASEIFDHHGVHPDRCAECGLDASSGSLGHGLGISVGMALVDRSKNVYCLLSDGEMQEGSVYEALQVAHENKLTNLKVYINCNGWGAYKALERDHIVERCRAFTNVTIMFRETSMDDYPAWLQGQIAHYKILNDEEYKEVLEILQ